jgi:hypothetical protein
MNEVKHYVMRPRQLSRGPQIDTELCVRKVDDGRFNLVIVAAERLRELRRQNKNSDRYITPVDALLDVQAGNLNANDYLAKVRDRNAKS